MKTAKALVAALVLTQVVTTVSAQAEPAKNYVSSSSSATAPANNREAKRYGAYLGILGDPHPTVLGVNLAYNVLSYLRASVGFGKISATSASINNSGFTTTEESMTTIGALAKFMMPDWNFSPSVSIGYSHVSLSDGLAFVDYKASNIYTGLGVDWQAESGFNLGAGLNLSLNSGAPTAPYINVGVFF